MIVIVNNNYIDLSKVTSITDLSEMNSFTIRSIGSEIVISPPELIWDNRYADKYYDDLHQQKTRAKEIHSELIKLWSNNKSDFTILNFD